VSVGPLSNADWALTGPLAAPASVSGTIGGMTSRARLQNEATQYEIVSPALPQDYLVEASRQDDDRRFELGLLVDQLENELGPITDEERRAIDSEWPA
jgi:hypothetical protein